MKKVLLAAILVIIGTGCAFAQKVVLITPNGGETLVLGSPQMISWSHSGLNGSETILIALEGTSDNGPIAYSKVSTGSIAWVAGKKMDGTFAKPAKDYRIIIEVRGNDDIYDLTDATFSLVPPASTISLMTPNGGESLSKGTLYDINWSFSGKNGFVSLTLMKDEQPLGLIAENLAATSFRFSWHIGMPLLNRVPYGLGGNYRIQIQWHLDQNPPTMGLAKLPATAIDVQELLKNSDRSDGVFSIMHEAEKTAKEPHDKKR